MNKAEYIYEVLRRYMDKDELFKLFMLLHDYLAQEDAIEGRLFNE